MATSFVLCYSHYVHRGQTCLLSTTETEYRLKLATAFEVLHSPFQNCHRVWLASGQPANMKSFPSELAKKPGILHSTSVVIGTA